MSTAGDELTRWARELADKIREAVEESIDAISPELEKLIGRGFETAEKGNHLYVRIPLPGCSKDSLNILVREREVEVSGEPAAPPFPEVADELKPRRSIHRIFTLPKRVNPGEAEAKYVDGILYLKIRITEARGVRVKIE